MGKEGRTVLYLHYNVDIIPTYPHYMLTRISQDGIDQYSEIETEDLTIQHCLTPESTANAAESVL